MEKKQTCFWNQGCDRQFQGIAMAMHMAGFGGEELRPRLNHGPMTDPICTLRMGDVVKLTPAIPDIRACITEEMTLEEYEKILEEKRKALLTLNTKGRKVYVKEFESMQQLSNKKSNDDIFIKLGSEMDKRKDAEKEEKVKKKKNGNKKGGDGEKKEKGSLTIVLKVDCLCDGCASKIIKYIRKIEGVETVKTESSSNKVTVIGAVDPTAIKEKLVKKTKKKVELISPQPKKDDTTNKEEKKPEKEKNKDSDNKQDKKPKEAPVTTADLKVQLKCQCQGCIDKIRKIVSETKGVHELKVDKQKELVTVKGTMDVKALAEALKAKLNKSVEIVPPKKEKDGNNEGGENGGGKKKNKGGNGGGGDGGNQANATVAAAATGMVQPEFGYMPGYPGYMPGYPGYGHPGYGYSYGHPHPHGHGYPGYVPGYPVSANPPHQMFNDENPHACAIM
ncbi:hypothetical protein REPUB_Repub05bG0198000 [Reevesia pubescens]